MLFLQNDSLHPVNCSDWTLRLSDNVSLTPTSDRSTAVRRRVAVDDFLAQRSYKLGALDSTNTERVSFQCILCSFFV